MRNSVVIVVFALALRAGAAVVTVSPGNLGTWGLATTSFCGPPPGSLTFVTGPSTPPLGTGSIRFDVNAISSPLVVLHDHAFDGVPLSELTVLGYDTFLNFASPAQTAPRMILSIETMEIAQPYEQLVFVPASNGTVTIGTWQSWNALNGSWDALFAFPTPPPTTLAAYIALHPNARLFNGGFGSIAIVGGGYCNGDTFSASVDAVRVATGGATTTFDFELAPATIPPIPTLTPWSLLLLTSLLLAITIFRTR